MKKRVFPIGKIAIMLVVLYLSINYMQQSCATTTIASGTCGDQITWTLEENGLLKIVGSGAMYAGSSVQESPWADYQEQVKQVEFSGNITSIGDRAFECNSKIETIILPDSIETIGIRAFAECTNLKKVKFSKKLSKINKIAFYRCSKLEEVELPEELMYLNEYAFYECSALKSIAIPSSLTLVDKKETTISETAIICSYPYTNAFYYARYFGRTFKNLETGEITTVKITNQDFLDALPIENVQPLGPTAHHLRRYNGNILEGYTSEFCHEKDITNENYQKIKTKVEEITVNCTTQREKAEAIFQWVYRNVDYVSALTGNATIENVYYFFNTLRGNCEVYTLLTNYMLYLCDIPTATVSNLTHMWSAAYVDGKWIFIDSTHARFDVTDYNIINQMTFAYDGLVYAIDDPTEGARVTGIAMEKEEIDQLKTFTIPTNSYMKGIYQTAFSSKIQLKAEVGTIAETFIRNNRTHYSIKNNYILGSMEEIIESLLGDVNGDGKVTLADCTKILAHVKKTKLLMGEELKKADINGDGKVTLADCTKVLAHVKKTKLLW